MFICFVFWVNSPFKNSSNSEDTNILFHSITRRLVMNARTASVGTAPLPEANSHSQTTTPHAPLALMQNKHTPYNDVSELSMYRHSSTACFTTERRCLTSTSSVSLQAHTRAPLILQHRRDSCHRPSVHTHTHTNSTHQCCNSSYVPDQ